MKKIAFVIAIAVTLSFTSAAQAKVKEKTATSNCQVITTYSAPKATGEMITAWFTSEEASAEKAKRLKGRTEMEALQKGDKIEVVCH